MVIDRSERNGGACTGLAFIISLVSSCRWPSEFPSMARDLFSPLQLQAWLAAGVGEWNVPSATDVVSSVEDLWLRIDRPGVLHNRHCQIGSGLLCADHKTKLNETNLCSLLSLLSTSTKSF